MCKECGCGKPEEHEHHDHVHPDGTSHDHPHPHPAEPSAPAVRSVSIERRILSRNDELARENREWLTRRGVVALNLISAPGAGKTLLLEKTLERLRGRVGCAVITGDQETDRDAKRLEGRGANVRQIETHSACHLDAERVGRILPEVVGPEARLLFIENVGNLVCPAAFDLGESFKVALLSVTEGEDKPVKYPTLFMLTPVVILTKVDLLPHLDYDVRKCRQHLGQVHPGVFTFELSARTGVGMDGWIDYLLRLTA
jgi:hydrogenase nickel incorporation protein HypB